MFSNCIGLVFVFVLSVSLRYCVSYNVTHDYYSRMWSVQTDTCSVKPAVEWTEDSLLTYLTSPCRYNKQMRPPSDGANLVDTKVYVYFLKASSGYVLEFQAQILLQLKWDDQRLNFSKFNTSFKVILGEKYLMNSIWLPHVYLSNERDSLVMGFMRKDDFVIIHNDGQIIFTTRLKSKVTCQMDVGKFPFDVQKCSLVMESWRYDAADLILKWEEQHPVVIQGGVNLTEFSLISWETSADFKQQYSPADFKNENFSSSILANNNYSSLILSFTLSREYGFYIMDYYIPSVLIVILSWVSFWLTPDALPARINLGSSTMLTFLQLGWTGAGTPKLSQFQYNNIWEIVCTLFIFLTLVEFAFVNTIHRSGFHKVPMKKPTSKYILKSSLASPPKAPRVRVRRTSSCPSSPELRKRMMELSAKPRHKVIEELSASDLASQLSSRLQEEKTKMEKIEEDKPLRRRRNVSIRFNQPLRVDENDEQNCEAEIKTFRAPEPMQKETPAPKRRRYSIINPRRLSIMPQFTMTNHEIAKWIDEKSRIVFPTAFFLFCVGYWSFLWI